MNQRKRLIKSSASGKNEDTGNEKILGTFSEYADISRTRAASDCISNQTLGQKKDNLTKKLTIFVDDGRSFSPVDVGSR